MSRYHPSGQSSLLAEQRWLAKGLAGPILEQASMTQGELTPDQLRRDPLPLRGRVAVVTGVSRRAGIGYAVARRLAALGASLFLHHYAPHDRDQPWGADPGGPAAVLAGVNAALAADGARVRDLHCDLALPEAPAQLITKAGEAFGHCDILVCNHARSGGDGPLGTLDVNPGPVDTGYAPPEVHEGVRRHFPGGRWGDPDDPARLIAWLVTDEAAWITGQVINTEGGFRRWA
jgi:NAD(P)-dependent dehydrogenase (short-subunit alcohol dehydrogenase family)